MSKKNNKIPFRERKKSKKVAGLLGIFLGAFGIHNFYLGKYVRGILQFILALIFIFTLKDNAEFLIDSLLMLGSLGVGKGIAILCNEVDINKKYRLKHASKEENIEYATSALKKFPATNSSLYIDYVSKNTTLSATDIKEIINKEKATINKRNQEIDDLKKQLEQEKKDKESELIEKPQTEIQQEKPNLEQVPTLNGENKQEQVNMPNSTFSYKGVLIGIIIVVAIGFLIFKGISAITKVTDSTGDYLARELLISNNVSYPNLYIDAMYTIGNIKNCSNSKIVENNGDKYIFKVTVYYNPKLNSGSTDLTKENQGTTYVVYNNKTGQYSCGRTLESVKSSDIWTKN